MALALKSGDGAGREDGEYKDGNEDEKGVFLGVFLDCLD